jgi:hypothetical protein
MKEKFMNQHGSHHKPKASTPPVSLTDEQKEAYNRTLRRGPESYSAVTTEKGGKKNLLWVIVGLFVTLISVGFYFRHHLGFYPQVLGKKPHPCPSPPRKEAACCDPGWFSSSFFSSLYYLFLEEPCTHKETIITSIRIILEKSYLGSSCSSALESSSSSKDGIN